MKQNIRRKFVFMMCMSFIAAVGCGKSVTGIQNGRLMPCPESPNCVSSYETDSSHFTEALTYAGPLGKARDAVVLILARMPEAGIVTSGDDYIHAEFRSRIFKFVDDVEFQFLETPKVIHVRSASRVGYSDLGVNKQRMEKIAKLFYEMTGIEASEK
jgi:uncharacterized protein (DUF1499 family)